jgi:plastocyanin
VRNCKLVAVALAAGTLALAGVAVPAAAAAEGTIKGTVTAGPSPGTSLANAVVMVDTPSAPVAADAPHARMEQRDDTFVPHVLAVPVGTVVDFPNRDPHLHNVRSTSPAKPFDLGMYGEGESKNVAFDRPGVVEIRCNAHPQMQAYVVVHDNPHVAITDAGGGYTITGVPSGRYRFRVWHESHEQHEGWVIVPDGGVARLDVKIEH